MFAHEQLKSRLSWTNISNCKHGALCFTGQRADEHCIASSAVGTVYRTLTLTLPELACSVAAQDRELLRQEQRNRILKAALKDKANLRLLKLC